MKQVTDDLADYAPRFGQGKIQVIRVDTSPQASEPSPVVFQPRDKIEVKTLVCPLPAAAKFKLSKAAEQKS